MLKRSLSRDERVAILARIDLAKRLIMSAADSFWPEYGTSCVAGKLFDSMDAPSNRVDRIFWAVDSEFEDAHGDSPVEVGSGMPPSYPCDCAKVVSSCVFSDLENDSELFPEHYSLLAAHKAAKK